MHASDCERYSRWFLALIGGLAGGACGLVTGPIVIIFVMMLDNYIYGGEFLGLEVAGSVIGAILGAVAGAGLGAVWPGMFSRPWRLTVARLMLIVLVSGPVLALVLASPLGALLVLANVLAVMPLVVGTILIVVRPLKPSGDGEPTSSDRPESPRSGVENAGGTF